MKKRKIFQEEHLIFQQSFRKFAEKELVPHVEQWEKDGIVPKSMFKKMGDNGYLCPGLEEEYGGYNADYQYQVIINEEMIRTGTHCFFVPLHQDVIVPYIHKFGNAEQKARWLPGCASGDIITAVAMTEPGAGSDLAAIRTTAVRDGDHYIVNGQKTFISNGINCDLCVLAVKTDTKVNPVTAVSLICVEADTPGFEKGRKLEKMGMHGQDTCELSFVDCRVPVANLLGQEGQGFKFMMENLQDERLCACVMAQAFAEAMLEMTIKYTKERTVFGKPVSSLQHNTFKMVEMATEVELGRTFVDDLIADFIAGEDIVMRVSMGKAWLAEMVNRVGYQCVQLYGGYGYMQEYPVCRYALDARVLAILAGSTEVMKLIVGRMMEL
jgi:acyl-CoA dehydrogenase